MKKIILLSYLLIVTACLDGKISHQYPENPAEIRKNRAGKILKEEVIIYDHADSKTEELSENKNKPDLLWEASVQVISDLMPVAIIDKNSRLIITKWCENKKNERIKLNILVKEGEILDENLSVDLINQKKDRKGKWQEKNNPDYSTDLIKKKILSRALELK
jgi:hypothetical protein